MKDTMLLDPTNAVDKQIFINSMVAAHRTYTLGYLYGDSWNNYPSFRRGGAAYHDAEMIYDELVSTDSGLIVFYVTMRLKENLKDFSIINQSVDEDLIGKRYNTSTALVLGWIKLRPDLYVVTFRDYNVRLYNSNYFYVTLEIADLSAVVSLRGTTHVYTCLPLNPSELFPIDFRIDDTIPTNHVPESVFPKLTYISKYIAPKVTCPNKYIFIGTKESTYRNAGGYIYFGFKGVGNFRLPLLEPNFRGVPANCEHLPYKHIHLHNYVAHVQKDPELFNACLESSLSCFKMNHALRKKIIRQEECSDEILAFCVEHQLANS